MRSRQSAHMPLAACLLRSPLTCRVPVCVHLSHAACPSAVTSRALSARRPCALIVLASACCALRSHAACPLRSPFTCDASCPRSPLTCRVPVALSAHMRCHLPVVLSAHVPRARLRSQISQPARILALICRSTSLALIRLCACGACRVPLIVLPRCTAHTIPHHKIQRRSCATVAPFGLLRGSNEGM